MKKLISFTIKLTLLLILSALSSFQAAVVEELPPLLTPGEITKNQDNYGPYYLYTPTSPSDPPQSLIVIHGTPALDLSAGETALYYAQNWAPFAEEQGWLLLVPAFSQAALHPEQRFILNFSRS